MTTRTAHTPGPWRQEADNLGCKTIIGNVRSEDGEIFTCTEIGYTHGLADETEDAANARLIAASPKLYDLAVAVAAHFEDTDAPLGAQARALLAEIDG